MATTDPKDKVDTVEVSPTGQATVIPTGLPAARAERWRWVRMMLSNRKALVGFVIIGVFLLMAIFAPIIAPGDPNAFVGPPNQPPSRQYILGTNGQGADMFAQLVWGARTSLGIAFAVGIVTTLIGIVIGMTAGYVGGRVDDVLSMFMNIVLIIPGLPLLVVLATFLPPGPLTIVLVLAATGWPWGARVLRSQTLSLREKDFVAAAIVSGESTPRIIFREILPNMTSIVVAGFFGSVTYAIGAEAGLEFLGLGNVSTVTWGTILFWAQNNAGLLTGAWWTFVPAGLAIALVAFAFSLINYAVDEITNPRLRAEREGSYVLRKHKIPFSRATPVLRAKQESAAGGR